MTTEVETGNTAEAGAVPGDVWQSITGLVDDISQDNTAIREKLVAIAEIIGKVASRAGVKYGARCSDEEYSKHTPDEGDQWWRKEKSEWGFRWYRLEILKYAGEWKLVVCATDKWPEHWDGSNWVGHPDPFEGDGVDTILFERASRWILVNAIERLPGFLQQYHDHLKERHRKYSEVKEMAEKILAAL